MIMRSCFFGRTQEQENIISSYELNYPLDTRKTLALPLEIILIAVYLTIKISTKTNQHLNIFSTPQEILACILMIALPKPFSYSIQHSFPTGFNHVPMAWDYSIEAPFAHSLHRLREAFLVLGTG